MLIKLLLFLITSVFALIANDLPPEHRTPDRDYDVIHSIIDIRVQFEDKSVEGSVEHIIRRFDNSFTGLSLDAEDMDISSVLANSLEKAFFMKDNKIHISLDEKDWKRDTVSIKVQYKAWPRTGLYFVMPDSVYPEKQLQAWTQGESQDNHHWVPLYDYPNDKATFEVKLTVPDSLDGVSNGELVSEIQNSDGTKTFHWRENFPMSSYLISFVVGDYVQIKDPFGDLPVSYWVYEDNKKEAFRSFGNTPDMIRFFNEKTGLSYPYEKYDQIIIEDFMFGGMENITLTHNTDRTMHDGRSVPDVSSDGLVAHELAHQWYGDLLTTKNWANIWLNEGFATFMSRQYREYNLGYDEGEYIRYNEIRAFKRNDRWNRRPTVHNRYYAPMELFDSHVYAKGSLILNMLKDVLGESLFWETVQYYTFENQYKNVETSDLHKAIEETTGQNLDWFFRQWVFTPGYPEFEVEWEYNRRTRMIELNVEQVQSLDNNSLFKMPVTLLIDNGELIRQTVWVEGKGTHLQLPSASHPKMVIFDEGNTIPKKLKFNKSIAELIYQLEYAPHILDRIWAARELKDKKGRKKVINALKKSITQDSFWGVRKESTLALSTLIPIDGDEFFLKAIHGQDNRVKRECIKALSNYDITEKIKTTLMSLVTNENNYYLTSDAFATLSKMDSASATTLVDSLLQVDSHNDVIRKSAIQHFSNHKSEENYEKLLQLSEYGGTSWDARAKAVKSIGTYYNSHPELMEKFIDWLSDPNYYVRTAAAGHLGKYGSKKHIPKLEQMLFDDPATGKAVSMAKYFINNKDVKKKSAMELENEKLKYQLELIESILNP